jgi:protein-tyrosine phosphatase
MIESAFERARRGDLVEVGCLGGIGRTGTVLACMAVLSGVPREDAVAWVRASYDERAVETREQEGWVGWFAGFASGESGEPRLSPD